MISSPAQVTRVLSSDFEDVEFKVGNLTAFFPSKISGSIDGKISFHLKQVKDDELRVALAKFGLWKEDIKVKYFLNEGTSEKPVADHIILLEDEPSPPESVEIHNGILKSYKKSDGDNYGIVIDNQVPYKLKINAVIDECLKRYLQEPPPSINKSVQFILHWEKNKQGKIKKVIHSLILTDKERTALNKKYGLPESTVQSKLMSPESLPDYEPLSPIHPTIRTDNIFKVGGIVEGESLIGYEKEYKKLRQKILDERKNILFVGLPKTGKTSLIKKLHQEAKSKNNLIEIFISNLQEFASKENPFAAFLFDIAEKIRNELPKLINIKTKNASDFYAGFDELQKCCISHDYEKHFKDTFKKLFQKIKRLGMHVLLSVDEFDSAEKIFKDGADYNIFEALRKPEYAINVVLISTRQKKKSSENVSVLNVLFVPSEFLKLISEKYDVSTRSETISLEGFSDGDSSRDIELIFSILKREYSIHLSAVQIKQIRYYAGRSPYIYSAFCYHIVKEKLQSGKNSFDIEKIYKDNVEPIIADYTKVLYTLLENDGQLDKINNILFDSENCNEESKNIRQFISIGYLKESNLKSERHQVLSSYFTDYLRKQYLSQYSSKDIAKNILNVHKLMKIIILKSFRDLTEDEWIKVMKTVYREVKDVEFDSVRFCNNIEKNKNSFKDCNKDSALFNALPLRSVFYVLQAYWQPVFKKYFGDQEFSSFEKDFELCAQIRDVVCHANESFIKEEKTKEIIEVNYFCIEILKLIGKNWQIASTEFDPLGC